jgi:DNA-binding beta-propeller fold protein YncE
MKEMRAWIFTALCSIALAACSNNSSGPEEAGTGAAFIYMTDYQTGALATFTPGDSAVRLVPLNALHTDVALCNGDTSVYVIERFGKDDVIVLDPDAPDTPTANYSLGNGSNPQDIVVSDDGSKAYVLRLNRANVLIINPANGDSLGTIDLSSYADADGLPEMVDGLLYNGSLYVLLQLLNQNAFFSPTGPGMVVKINTSTNAVDASIALTIENPEQIAEKDGIIYAVGGPWGDLSAGGVDKIVGAATTAIRVAEGSAFRGRGQSIALVKDSNVAWVVVSQEWPTGAVYAVNLTSGSVVDSLAGLVSPARAVVGGSVLVVSDRNGDAPGIFTFDATTGDLTQGPISTPLPPDAVLFSNK